MRPKNLMTAWAWAMVLLLAAASGASANAVFSVTLNTNPLMGLAGPFAVVFQLTDGSGSGDNNNTVTLSNFTFGGGSAGGCPAKCQTFGAASGDIGSTVTLNDSDFANFFGEDFLPGTSLSFQVDLTTNVDAGGTPDAFGFGLLDNQGPIPTLDPLGSNMLLTIDIDSANPAILTYATAPDSNIVLDAPTIGAPQPPDGQVPEPSSWILIGIGMVGLIGIARRNLKP